MKRNRKRKEMEEQSDKDEKVGMKKFGAAQIVNDIFILACCTHKGSKQG